AELQAPWVSWVVIRAVVLLAAVAQLARRRADDVVLMASITAFLWLGAYPSANFMHQWWTASLTIAPFIVCVRKAVSHLITRDGAISWAAVGLVCVVIMSGMIERARAANYRVKALTETLAEPLLL